MLLEFDNYGDKKTVGRNLSVVTLECCGVLAGVKAIDIVSHIEASWARGQQAVALLRHELLPANMVDELAPLRNGGVHLHKIFGVMHDTCHATNKVATLMIELREQKAHVYHGEDTWAQ